MFLAYLVAGIIGSSNAILWGVYGDLLVEKFEGIKVARSLVIGGFVAIYLYLLNPNLPIFIVTLLVIAFERSLTEIYKALLRREDQSKYQIPSDLNFKLNYGIKFVLGVLLIAFLLATFFVIDFSADNLWLALVGGVIVAIGGAAKDAPYEGFDKLKFWRSPVVGVAFGIFLFTFFKDLPSKYFLIAVPGGERIISESYKKIVKGKIPGKFKSSLKRNKKWLERRKNILYLYGLNVASIVLLFLIAI